MRQSQPDLTLWEIGDRLALGTKLTNEELAGKSSSVRKKSLLAVAASKKLALARRIIDGVGQGVFPAFSTRS